MPQIIPYRESMREAVIEIWEASVRATHHFLAPEDIDYFKTIVETMDFSSFAMHCVANGDRISGFVGVWNCKIEMLFVHPDAIRSGLGKALLSYAVSSLNAASVDVNEQNEKAVRFYESQGFRQTGRTPTDNSGKPYPILEMRLEKH